jgi:hypothetical protein
MAGLVPAIPPRDAGVCLSLAHAATREQVYDVTLTEKGIPIFTRPCT